MSDTSKFVNAYIENAMTMIHDNVALVLQLKAQAKVVNDMLAEKDERIAVLQNEVESIKSELSNSRSNLSSYTEQINSSQANARKWEEEVEQLRNQMEHMQTFVNQINEMKKMLRGKDQEIEELKLKLNPVKVVKSPPSKKDINKKEVIEKPVVIEEPLPPEAPKQADDF